MSTTTLIEAIKDDLGYLKLARSAEVFASLAENATRDGHTHLEFLAALVAEETTATRQRRLNARLRFAHFPYRKTIDDFDFEFQPSIDPNIVGDLTALEFVDAGHPILL
jgi:DNA replication protein DnaC